MRILLTLSFFACLLSSCSTNRQTLRFEGVQDEFEALSGTEMLDQLDIQTPPPNFDQTPYRTPEKAEFQYSGHITSAAQLRVKLFKDGKKYTGFYTTDQAPEDTIRLSGMPIDSTKWNSKIELITDQDTAMSFITAPLDEYQSVYFEMVGTYGKAGREPEEGEVFYLYRQDFSLPVYRLSKVPETVLSPSRILSKVKKIGQDSYSLRQVLIDYNLILSRSDLLTLELDRESYTTIQPDSSFSLRILYKNLFGTPEDEAIIEVSYMDMLYFYSFFYKDGSDWKQVPSIIRLGRESAAQVPCLQLDGYPEDQFWMPEWKTLRRPGEYSLTGRTQSGYCGDGIDRGAEVYFYAWTITPKEARMVFSTREFSYWYASPSPAPVGRVIKRQLSFGEEFPKKLYIQDDIQEPEYNEKGSFVRLKTVKSFTTELPIFRK